ncbi:hypothetical protein T09_7451 [Trichinella sp. T9]|nr:hypothetical protein T09_7451 [Trichinella sp. T9]
MWHALPAFLSPFQMEPNMQYNSNSLPCACSLINIFEVRILFLIGDCRQMEEQDGNFYIKNQAKSSNMKDSKMKRRYPENNDKKSFLEVLTKDCYYHYYLFSDSTLVRSQADSLKSGMLLLFTFNLGIE